VATLDDAGVRQPLDAPNHAVISTINDDGTVRGTATSKLESADEHIERLTKKYMNQDSYPFRQEGEQRIKFLVEPERVRHQKQR
jgi:archaellum component FlaC